MDKFAALNAFVAVVDHGGFAPAARRMGLAPSSLTRQISLLEEALGTLLVNRSTRSVTLTDAGARYLEDARRILDDMENADRAVSEQGGSPIGVLRISLPVAFGRLHVGPALPLFLRRFPEMRLDISLSDTVVNLVEERIDIAVRLGSLNSSSLIARKLAPHRRVICGSPDYIAERGMPMSPHDLPRHNCLLFDYLTGDTTWSLIKDGARERVSVSGNLRASGSELLREAAIGGAGLILMPTWLVGPDLSAGRLVPVLEEWSVSPGPEEGAIWALYLSSRRGSRKVTCFLDFLAEHFGSPPYWDTAGGR
jgi:DNA-binding transcriptional LysR family regulator